MILTSQRRLHRFHLRKPPRCVRVSVSLSLLWANGILMGAMPMLVPSGYTRCTKATLWFLLVHFAHIIAGAAASFSHSSTDRSHEWTRGVCILQHESLLSLTARSSAPLGQHSHSSTELQLCEMWNLYVWHSTAFIVGLVWSALW